MVRLLAADLYRVLKDKRVFVIIAFHFVLFILELSRDYTYPFIEYIGNGVVIRERLAMVDTLESVSLIDCLGTLDLLVVTLIYAMFFFSDDNRDKTFVNMCTIYKSRSLVFIANYITLCVTSLGFAAAKLLGVSIVAFIYGTDVHILSERNNYIGVIGWFIAMAAIIAVLYSVYTIFHNIYIPIVMLFGPLTITFSPRFMEILPWGSKVYKFSALYLTLPSLLAEMTEWDQVLKWILYLIAATVVSIAISSVILEKRDVR